MKFLRPISSLCFHFLTFCDILKKSCCRRFIGVEFKELYTKNNIEYSCRKLYGPFPLINDYKFSTNKKGMKVIIPIRDNNYKDIFYAEIDEYNFFYDVIRYGSLLYDILKADITPLKKSWMIPNSFENSTIQIVSEITISKHFNELKEIITDFISKYTYCFVPQRYFPVKYKINQGIPLFPIINHILFIFMIHTAFDKLSTGFDSYKELYNSMSIKTTNSNLEIMDILIDYLNIYSLPFYHISSFNLELLRIDNNVIPITVTPNLFSFAFEVLQNNITTRSFYSFNEYYESHQYIGFRKCVRCQKNIVDTEMDRERFLSTPRYKKVYCDDCKHEVRKITSNKYEHSIRILYDELKNNVDKCNPNLATEIRNLKPKDKVKKSYLQRLYAEYRHDIQKKE